MDIRPGAFDATLQTPQSTGASAVLLTTEARYDHPYPWFLTHLGVAVLFALAWRRFFGQGPLERLVARTASMPRRLVLPAGSRKP